MEQIITPLVSVLISGGANALTATLVLVIMLLLVDRRRILVDKERIETKMDKLVDQYHAGNTHTADALQGLHLVLIELKGRIRP